MGFRGKVMLHGPFRCADRTLIGDHDICERGEPFFVGDLYCGVNNNSFSLLSC